MTTLSTLPMLMNIANNNRQLYNLIYSYYEREQLTLPRNKGNKKKIARDFDDMTCSGTATITAAINVDKTVEGRSYFMQMEDKYKSIYN